MYLIQFKSEIKIGLELFENSKLSYSYSHISNNDWGDTNPGTDNQQITFSKKLLIIMSLKDCYNFEDFRKLAKKKFTSTYISLY